MCDDLQIIKEIAPLYKQPMIETKDGFQCPVCKKVLKTENGMAKHMAKQDCYSFSAIFGGTRIEDDAWELMRAAGVRFMSRKAFRASKVYSSAVRFVIYCNKNKVDQIGAFYSWIETTLKTDKVNFVLSRIKNDDALLKFRVFLLKNPSLIDETFAKKHHSDLIEDPNFFIRSLEKAQISFETIFKSDELSEFASNLQGDYAIRMEALYEKVF